MAVVPTAAAGSTPVSTGNIILDSINQMRQESGSGDSSSINTDDDRQSASSSESTDDDGTGNLLNDSDSTPPDSSDGTSEEAGETTPAATKEQKVSGNKETIVVTDEKGKRKVEIDYSDRAAIRKAFELMHGARKWQAERDRAASDSKALREEHTKLKEVWDGFEGAFKENGIEGIIDLAQGKPGAHKEWLQKQYERQKFLDTASPKEIAQLQQQERLAQLEQKLAKSEEEGKKREERVTQEREQAELRAVESTVHPVFEKYRFADKLGDADDEAMFDDMLWNSTMKRLKPYEDDGHPITRELVDREFRAVSTSLRKRIGSQAEKKAAQVVEQKKQEATENAQASTMSAYKKGGVSQEASDLIRKGDLGSLFKNWGKYSKAFKR